MVEGFFLGLSSTEVFAISCAYFAMLYVMICVPVAWLANHGGQVSWLQKIVSVDVPKGQTRSEIFSSLVSILMFGFIGVFNQFGVKQGFLAIEYHPGALQVALEVMALFFWNDIHFYIIHRILHFRPLFKSIHFAHHRSRVVSPYSAFRMHWLEALLLGTVMPTAMLMHKFGVWSLLSLPVMSLVLNALGHSNLTLGSFTRRHAAHHQVVTGNYGFLLPWFDQWFQTGVRE